jgi:hypothetical protein
VLRRKRINDNAWWVGGCSGGARRVWIGWVGGGWDWDGMRMRMRCTCYTEIAILHLLYKMCNDICYTKRMHLLYKKHALAIQKQQSGICYTNCEITSAVKTFYSHMHYEFAIRWQSKEAGRAEGAEGQGGSELGSAEKKKNK